MEDVVDALLNSVTPGNLTNETLLALSLVLSQQTVVAALDLVENHAVTRWTSPWGRILNYTVAGSTYNYVVTLSLPNHKSPDVIRRAGASEHELFLASAGSASDKSWRPRHQQGPPPSFCSCPAFAYTILLASPDSESSPLMCKHILAIHLAERLQKTSEKVASEDEDFERLAQYL